MAVSQRRLWIIGVIILAVVILVTIALAPSGNGNRSGSTYSKDPSGYGAWYDYMKQRGTSIERWRKSEQNLPANPPQILVRINPTSMSEYFFLNAKITDWVGQGNTLIILGVNEPVTQAKFTTFPNHDRERIKIDTRRRKKISGGETNLLGDTYGAIVWSQSIGQGQIIYAVTPYLAANAYQDYPANYEFLARLVTRSNQPILVDEYIHGYKDAETLKAEIGGNIWSYLIKTPLFLLFCQTLLLLGLVIWAGNYRFGKPMPLAIPVQNNSVAYIEALAAVLHKADHSEFLLSTITASEQLTLQKKLGLGNTLLDRSDLLQAVKQAGKPTTDLEIVLQFSSRQRPINDVALLEWLAKWKNIRS